jgi:cysteine-rich repeat protein
VCGDGHVNLAAGEQCDDGPKNGTPGDPCNPFCHIALCGDGIRDPGEECDGGGVDTATCDANCTLAVCGDGYVNAAAGEACDAGPANGTPGSGCNGFCQIMRCGNGTVEPGEQCDSGGVDTAFCDADCTIPACGDGHVNLFAGEECDDGPANGTPTSRCSLCCRFMGEPCVGG